MNETHRGGFGEFGGEIDGFIERTFRERIVVVGVTSTGADPEQSEMSLDELELLVATAGTDAVGRLHQRRDQPDPATYVGSGKAQEIRALAEAVDCDTVVFDDELSPAQQFNLEKILGRSALDRTTVILDIFAQNAGTFEGKAQVELAQLRYRLPRLRGVGRILSQQGGGIGTRGPGETRLEVDRRRLLRRVHKLDADLRKVRAHRRTRSKRRASTRNRAVAIVGYTNAGKSCLLNRLTAADVLVEDRLFATLDTTTRGLSLPGGETVFVTDTVGFVRKLPHQLVTAFAATLDVVRDADLLIHVVDGAGADPSGSIETVRSVLAEIGAAHIPELLVFNKCDRFHPDGSSHRRPDPSRHRPDPSQAGGSTNDRVGPSRCHDRAVTVSALTGENMDLLRHAIAEELRSSATIVELLVPWERGDVLAGVHREGQVLSETPEELGMRLRARLDQASVAVLRDYVQTPQQLSAHGLSRSVRRDGPEPDASPVKAAIPEISG